jgi:DUF218 domain
MVDAASFSGARLLQRLGHLFRKRVISADPTTAHPDSLQTRAAITTFLFLRDKPAPVDFAFVLGSPSITSIEPAIDLHRRGFTKKLMISGFGPESKSSIGQPAEADVYKHFAVECGIPAEDIITETQATNTKENFSLSHPIIEREFGWSNVRTVSISGKPFHMRRALMTARVHWPAHVNLVMLPSNHPEDPNEDTWWQTDGGRAFILSELRSIGSYGLAGDIGGF